MQSPSAGNGEDGTMSGGLAEGLLLLAVLFAVVMWAVNEDG